MTRWLPWLLLFPFALWSAGAVLYAGHGPSWPRGLLLLLLLALPLRVQRPQALLPLLLVGTLFFFAQRPQQQREWSEDQSRLPRITNDGTRFTVSDVRRFRYRSPTDWDADWGTATWDRRDLIGADMGVERFSDIEAVAHTFVQFRFAGREPLVASVEIRKERGESFSPLRGLYRQYETMIVLGDPADLIDLRVVNRRNPVILHPLVLPKERVLAFLDAVLADADRLSREPEWYNTLTGSCSTTLAGHIRAVGPVPWDWRMVVPGHADALAWELGWLGEGELEDLRRAHTLSP